MQMDRRPLLMGLTHGLVWIKSCQVALVDIIFGDHTIVEGGGHSIPRRSQSAVVYLYAWSQRTLSGVYSCLRFDPSGILVDIVAVCEDTPHSSDWIDVIGIYQGRKAVICCIVYSLIYCGVYDVEDIGPVLKSIEMESIGQGESTLLRTTKRCSGLIALPQEL
jgi:hypothetical protein